MNYQKDNEELDRIMEEAEMMLDTDSLFKVWKLDQITDYDFGPQDWLIENIFPLESINLLSGEPASFKTWITLEMAKSISLGLPFLGKFQTVSGAVLMIDEEDHLRYIKDRVRKLSIPRHAPIHYLSQVGVNIGKPDHLQKLITIAKEIRPKLIVLDSLVRIHTGDENDSKSIANVFRVLKDFVKLGATILITHHHRKQGLGSKTTSQSIRGSSDILAGVDSHIAVEKKDGEVTFLQTKLRVAPELPPFKIKVTAPDADHVKLEYVGEIPKEQAQEEKAKELILEILKDGEQDRASITARIKDVTQIGGNAIGKALRSLIDSNDIVVKVLAKNKRVYCLIEQALDF